ncbi:hypothetical protein ANCDUO_22692 [Ancylostoma duodenale]|uniref:Uncharacterized protein n=1 Tax=Ancylostoma duodenale TaxID=51022 RepID=A0A0C2FQN4_9BILA|nr:hypothetical protein ANCDUO_22692 [Ancylostoma duodenale]
MSRDPYEQLSRSPVDSADHEESRIVGDEDGSPRRDAVDDREGALEPVQSRNSGEQEADDYEGLVEALQTRQLKSCFKELRQQYEIKHDELLPSGKKRKISVDEEVDY